MRIYFSFMCPSRLCQISKTFSDSNSPLEFQAEEAELELVEEERM
jgi:hypothetical protein